MENNRTNIGKYEYVKPVTITLEGMDVVLPQVTKLNTSQVGVKFRVIEYLYPVTKTKKGLPKIGKNPTINNSPSLGMGDYDPTDTDTYNSMALKAQLRNDITYKRVLDILKESSKAFFSKWVIEEL